jgi:ATP-binding cassette subfamily B protein
MGHNGQGGAAANVEQVSAHVQDWSLLSRLLRLLAPYWIEVCGSLLSALAAAGLQIFNPLVISVAIDVYFLHRRPVARWLEGILPGNPIRGLAVLSAAYLAGLLMSLICESSQAYLAQWSGQKAMADLRRKVIAHLHRLPIDFYDSTPVGRLVTRATTDIESLNDLFSNGIVSVLASGVMTIFFLVAMLRLNSRLGIVLATILPIFMALTLVFRRIITRSQQRGRILLARINAFIAENVSGIDVVHLFNLQVPQCAKFDEMNGGYRTVSQQWVTANAWFLPVIEAFGALSQAALLLVGARLLHGGELTVGTLVAFLQYGTRFLRPIQEIGERYGVLQSSVVSAERVFALLDTPAPGPREGKRVDSSGAARIQFEHVWFAYKPGQWVLRDVSFEIGPGEMLAVVGHTGAGKTTLTNLLLRFYEPQRGVIRLGGVDIRALSLPELRRQFGVVLQDAYMREGSVLDNIRFGGDGGGNGQALRSAGRVGLAALAEHLPEGLETRVQERGDNLSSGQKQIIAFARALAQDPRYLILDEATSSIDPETESRIQSSLDLLFRDRTSLVIAHRLSTVLNADRILVMHKGEPAESGNHKELIARKGLYWRLYQVQFGLVSEECE